jgi:hypothetical protein
MKQDYSHVGNLVKLKLPNGFVEKHINGITLHYTPFQLKRLLSPRSFLKVNSTGSKTLIIYYDIIMIID